MKLLSTYRLQLNKNFTFKDANAHVDYLDKLGIKTVYASPLLRAKAGSMNGYDVMDPTQLNPELGSLEDFKAWSANLRAHKMNLLLDWVPNHMSLTAENPWVWDLLKYGTKSRFAPFFSIDWAGRGKIVLPILGGPLMDIIRKGELGVDTNTKEPVLWYYDWRFPLTGEIPSDFSPANLVKLIQAQPYDLVPWKEGGRFRNYRRFFDIDQLIGLNIENPDVFEALHKLPFELISKGDIQGLRIDHIDGLKKPGEYLSRLYARLCQISPEKPILLVEKIVGENENLPEAWPVQGTTGYEFLNEVSELFIDWDRMGEFEKIYAQTQDSQKSFFQVESKAKAEVLEKLFSRELEQLLGELYDIAQLVPTAKDIPKTALQEALTQISLKLPVYRTYFEGKTPFAGEEFLAQAFAQAQSQVSNAGALNFMREVFHFKGDRMTALRVSQFILRWQQFTGPLMAKGFEDTALYRYNKLLCLNEVGGNPARSSFEIKHFHAFNKRRGLKYPQGLNATSTHDTKRSEDVRARISVLSEIPELWEENLRQWMTLNADKKHPAQPLSHNTEIFIYQTLLGVWPVSGSINRAFVERMKAYFLKSAKEAKTSTDWIDPSMSFENSLLSFVEKILNPLDSEAFLESFKAFLERILWPGALNSLSQCVLKATLPGVPDFYQGSELWDLSLVDPDNRRTVDFHVRSEFLEGMKKIPPSAAELLRRWTTGEIKLFLTWKLNEFRRQNPALFDQGSYEPLEFTGPASQKVFGFFRAFEKTSLLVCVPRLISHDKELTLWPQTYLDAKILQNSPHWQNLLDESSHLLSPGEKIPVAQLFQSFPIGIYFSRLG